MTMTTTEAATVTNTRFYSMTKTVRLPAVSPVDRVAVPIVAGDRLDAVPRRGSNYVAGRNYYSLRRLSSTIDQYSGSNTYCKTANCARATLENAYSKLPYWVLW